jgi:ribokinase
MPVVVFGSLNMDLVTRAPRLPRPGETVLGDAFFRAPGGKGANQAVAAARAGAKTRLIGRVGDDALGRELLAALREADVDTGAVRFDPEAPTGTASIAVDRSGQNQIVVAPGANARVGEDEARGLPPWLDRGAVLVLQMEIPQRASLAAAREARRAGAMIVLDPAPACDEIERELCELADVLTPNAHEASWLSGIVVEDGASAEAAAERLRDSLGGSVIVTIGEEGAVLADARGIAHLPPFRAVTVDTTAAGDAFAGALATALDEGRGLRDAALFASAAGALAASASGALPSLPRRASIDALLARG